MFQYFSDADTFDGVEGKIEGTGKRGKKCNGLISTDVPAVSISVNVRDPEKSFRYRIKEIKE